MKQIIKGKEPKSLTEHRARGGVYDNLPKNELKEQLLSEQGNICCYCMKRIPQRLTMDEINRNFRECKIEHVKSQFNHPSPVYTLHYHNLLISCNGNQGETLQSQTCDSHKGRNDLSFNPADKDRNVEEFLRYNGEGKIFSDNTLIDKELNDILNLNTDDLKRVRAEFYKRVNAKIHEEGLGKKGKEIQKRFFESEKRQLLSKHGGKFVEYCMVGVYLLNKKLQKL